MGTMLDFVAPAFLKHDYQCLFSCTTHFLPCFRAGTRPRQAHPADGEPGQPIGQKNPLLGIGSLVLGISFLPYSVRRMPFSVHSQHRTLNF